MGCCPQGQRQADATALRAARSGIGKYKSDTRIGLSVAVFYSFGSLKEYDGGSNHPVATIEYLMQCDNSGIPHEPRLKKNCTCTITRNLNTSAGLVKNRRVIVHDIHRNFVTIRLICPNSESINDRNTFCIPRTNFSFQPARCPRTVDRRQPPLRLACATTFNSC